MKISQRVSELLRDQLSNIQNFQRGTLFRSNVSGVMVLILRESFDALCRVIEELYFRYSKVSKGHNSVKRRYSYGPCSLHIA